MEMQNPRYHHHLATLCCRHSLLQFIFSFASHTSPAVVSKLPKIPHFSGDELMAKGEVLFYEWRHEVRCLRKDPSHSSPLISQARRTFLAEQPDDLSYLWVILSLLIPISRNLSSNLLNQPAMELQ